MQHHPEASPGPQDSFYLFERFASRDRFSYAGKALSAMRMQFGGHHEKKSDG